MPKPKTKPRKAVDLTLDEVRIKTGRGWRKLKSGERAELVRIMSARVPDQPFDVMRLAPKGSFLARMLRHFDETDISYSMPLMSTVMFAASWLTQNGAHLAVPGIGTIHPTLWNIGLAESGSSKTLASEEVAAILSEGDEPPVSFLPPPQSAPQWIIDLSEQNGAFWFQDEVGKLFQAIFTQSNMVHLKPWMLNAYSHQPISNRLKSEEVKLRIDKPAFTFHGLTVLETWPSEIDMSSMLDGFCQRMTYYIAEPRADTDMYDHFLYFAGEMHDGRRAQLRDIWHALCAQENAGGEYTLDNEVVPFLETWRQSLRETWGRSDLPRSFVRRIGFATLRYLPVLQFLLGKSRRKIDVETAELATRFAEYHFRSALALIQRYDAGVTSKVQRIADVSRRLADDGKPVTKRNVTRTLSRAQRAEFDGEEIDAI
jgi:hypothetical protein